MFAINPYAYHPNNRTRYRRKKFYRRYDTGHYGQHARQNPDLRLIVLRHGERVDVTLGEKWYNQIFGGVPSAPPESYRNPYLPLKLPYRQNSLLYEFDPPITRQGEQKAYYAGQLLSKIAGNIDSCYVSPASRCVITANAVLQGMNRPQISMRLEPYLFEPVSWNKPLQYLGDMSPFMSTREWKKSGYNIDRRYQRIGEYVNVFETETEFWNRSLEFFQSIEYRYDSRKHMPGVPSTALIVGHAATPIIYSIIAARQKFDPDSFIKQCGDITYLQTVLLERDATTRIWSVRPIPRFI